MIRCVYCNCEIIPKQWELSRPVYRRFCSVKCAAKHRADSGPDRFWNRVFRGTKDDCWPWYKPVNSRYPIVTIRFIKNGTMPAHRAAFILHYGRNPQGMVCHRCGNRMCCNPYHLYEGTAKQNTEDAKRHGTLFVPPVKIGEDAHAAKLSNEQVAEICRVFPNLKYGEKGPLAKKYGITVPYMRRLGTGKAKRIHAHAGRVR